MIVEKERMTEENNNTLILLNSLPDLPPTHPVDTEPVDLPEVVVTAGNTPQYFSVSQASFTK